MPTKIRLNSGFNSKIVFYPLLSSKRLFCKYQRGKKRHKKKGKPPFFILSYQLLKLYLSLPPTAIMAHLKPIWLEAESWCMNLRVPGASQ